MLHSLLLSERVGRQDLRSVGRKRSKDKGNEEGWDACDVSELVESTNHGVSEDKHEYSSEEHLEESSDLDGTLLLVRRKTSNVLWHFFLFFVLLATFHFLVD